jgi:peptidoglycan/LPS O-acetylase OafA/YrhL
MFRLLRNRPTVPYSWRAGVTSTVTDAPIPTPTVEIALPRLDDRAAIRFYRPELDVLRFLAFFAVFFHHTAMYMPEFFAKHHVPAFLGVLESTLAKAGGFGVDLFFVLSAYLITELLMREKSRRGVLDIPSFYVRRILRIWPLYYCFVALVAAVPALHASDHFSSHHFVPFLFLLGNWGCVAFGFPSHSVCGLLWSVCVEEQFYLLWPPVVSRLSRRNILFAAVVMIVVANVARALAILAHAHYPQVWCNTLARLDPIAVGVLVAVLLSGELPRFGRVERSALLVLGLVGLLFVGGYADLASSVPSSPWAGTRLPRCSHRMRLDPVGFSWL